MAIYKGLTFDGINSLDYGIYITGEAVYNAPERDVEMVTIPGRNGDFALDNGRFNNITVTYPAGAFGQDQPDFADKIQAFRNALASRVGYCRITDEYNPNEYRMAVYKNGLEVSPVSMSRAGEFELVFDCKPQRFLTSGETKQTITSGQTLTNPTLFNSRPLLEVEGYGAVNLNDEAVVIHNEPIGRVDLGLTQTVTQNTASAFAFSVAVNDPSVYQNGDEIWFSTATVQMKLTGSIYRAEIADKNNMNARANGSGSNFLLSLDIPMLIAEAGVDGATYTGWVDVKVYTNSTTSYTYRYNLSVLWTATNNTITYTLTLPSVTPLTYTTNTTHASTVTAYANSTKSALGNPLYIDLDIGEAYKIEGGAYVPINSAVEIPAELPTLKPGANEITFDNTITKLEITPRWWRV